MKVKCCRNVSHCHRQQSFSGLPSPGRSHYTITQHDHTTRSHYTITLHDHTTRSHYTITLHDHTTRSHYTIDKFMVCVSQPSVVVSWTTRKPKHCKENIKTPCFIFYFYFIFFSNKLKEETQDEIVEISLAELRID